MSAFVEKYNVKENKNNVIKKIPKRIKFNDNLIYTSQRESRKENKVLKDWAKIIN